jgi:hypothetical protein
MQTLNIVTPCSRPENLSKILPTVEPGREFFELYWYIVFDWGRAAITDELLDYLDEHNDFIIYGLKSDSNGVSGNSQRNQALDWITKGWVWFLDDDNLPHSNFFSCISQAINDCPDAEAFIFEQVFANGWVRKVNPLMVRETHIDQAQFVLHRDLIGTKRYDQCYTADGRFVEQIYNAHPQVFKFIHRPLCFYNALRS